MTNGIKRVLKKTRDILFADPKLLYEEERHLVNEPFYFEGDNRKAILLIHGWTTVPYELRRLGKYLNDCGYTVKAPLLRGHGTLPQDLENVKWKNWLDDLQKELYELEGKYEKIYVAGTSIGSCLALLLARNNPEISGLVLMATPYKLRLERFVIPLANFLVKFRKYNKKFYPPTFGISTTITRLISYQTYPIASAIETFNLIQEARKNLDIITQPCFLLQSSSDHVVSKKSIEKIYNCIGSKIKKMKYIKRAYHTFISDIKNERVLEEILNFLRRKLMNIAIFTNNYLPNPYGVTQSIESFRRQLEKNGHFVFIFAPNHKNYKDENPNIFRYPAIDIEFKIKFPLAIPYSRRIDGIIKDLNIDIIHSQHPNLLGSTAMKWARRKKIPLVFTWHTLYDQYAHFVPFIPAKWTAKYIIKKAVKYANKCDFVVTPTESVKKIIQNWGVNNKNIKAVSSGVDEENFANPDRKVIRGKYGIKDDEILLLLISRLTKEKNVEFIFDSLIPLLKKYKDVNPHTKGQEPENFGVGIKFLISGGGDLVPKLKKMVADNDLGDKIIFNGVVERGKLKDYYAAGDIFVYASKSETQGMIITEAMYAGLPIVAVDAPGICDLVQNNINGFSVLENKEKFSKAVEKLIGDKNLREQFGKAGEKIGKEKYTDDICTGKLLDIYKKTIESKKL